MAYLTKAEKDAYKQGLAKGTDLGYAQGAAAERAEWEAMPLKSVADLRKELKEALVEIEWHKAKRDEQTREIGKLNQEIAATHTMLDANRMEVTRLSEALKAKTDPRTPPTNDEFKQGLLDAAKETNRFLRMLVQRV